MRFNKLYLITIAITLFIAGCNSTQTDDISSANPYPNDVANSEIASGENTNWARENLDLQRVGNLLEKSETAEEFEYLLNSDEGINNLDLNGDGYVDYMSVAEYDDRDDNQRGFTIFDRFGPNEIQQIASIIFNRDSFDNPGARILLQGNEQIYGDNNNYETNWLDRVLPIAQYVFGNRDTTYESPYYYQNYPDNYEPYQVVETPVYRTRIEQYYPQPVFIQTSNPTITEIKIKSKYKDKSIDKIYAKLAKPSKDQIKFREKNPNFPEFVPVKNGKVKNDFDKREKEFNKDLKKERKEFEKREKKIDKEFEKREKREDKKFEKRNKPDKFEKQNVKFDRPKNEGSKGDKDKNRGGGNGNGNGGGKDKGGKGKGKG